MKSNLKIESSLPTTAALVGLQIIGLSASMADPSHLIAKLAPTQAGDSIQSIASSTGLRASEAAHLEVYATCKGGHAAFAPVVVDDEPLSKEIESLFSQLV